jgi:PAS domain S-box-containing protein
MIHHAWDEADRLRALNSYAVLDTEPEAVYDEVTKLVAQLFDAPMSAVTLVDEARQWFKSQVGLGVSETPIDTSFCKIGLLQGGSLTVPDTLVDAQFACNPLVTGQPGIRFYAGESLETSDGFPIGMLCVLDDKPRPEGITGQQRLMLKTLAGLVMGQLELRRTIYRNEAAEAALLAERLEVERLNAILENTVTTRTEERDQIWEVSHDLMVVFDRAGRIERVNPACAALTGTQPCEGRLFSALLHADDRALFDAQLARLGEGAARADFEARAGTPDGAVIQWQLAPLPQGFFASGRDLSRQRMMEEQLRQAQKMEAIGQLTGGIAHDFNNLLQGISGALEIMDLRLGRGRHEGLERYISTARRGTERAGALTHRLLSFSRRQPVDTRPIDVVALVRSMEELLRRTLGERIAITLDVDDTTWAVAADGNQFENALLNLCINGRDAMPDGGRLTLRAGNVFFEDESHAGAHGLLPGAYVHVAVTDTGTGMSAETLSRAFEPFYTTKAMGQGTGLGLSMVYGFTQQSKGHVHIASRRDYGTTVGIYLPRYASPRDAETADAAAARRDAPLKSAVILVVEDDEAVRQIVVEHLNESGYTVLQAQDGAAGLAVIASGMDIDLLLTDIGLPGMTGRELAQAARIARPDLKLVYMTGYDANVPQAFPHLQEDAEVIIKPFALADLVGKVSTLIGR